MRKWMSLVALVLLLGCTLGEAPPRAPGSGAEPDADRAVEAPDTAASAEAEARAAELLERARAAYEAMELEQAFETAEAVAVEYAATDSAPRARLVAARSALALGRYERALELAEAVEPADSAGAAEAREIAELASDALAPPAADPVILGAVLPRTGPRVLVRYADWVLEGIQLAVEEAERERGRRIELVVADDSGGARVSSAMARLERQGAVGIIGPLMPEHLMGAALARRNDQLVLVSPTATERPRWRQSYSVNASDARGAQELGRFAAELGLKQAAVLYPRVPEYERKATAFAEEFSVRGGRVRAMVPYDSGTTTFEAHMEQILERVSPTGSWEVVDTTAEQRPFALFVPAPQRDVPQIAPQISFYGLDSAGVQVFGDAAWASSAVRRVVPRRDLEGVIAASHFPPGGGSALADSAFTRAYEERYRRTLENPLPAYGYDAAQLLLQAVPNRTLTPAELARRFRLLARIRGATGVLSVRDGEVVRIPYLVEIRRGELQPAPFSWEYELPVPKPPLPDSLQEEGPGR